MRKEREKKREGKRPIRSFFFNLTKKTSFKKKPSINNNNQPQRHGAEFAAKDEELKGRVEAARRLATASFEASWRGRGARRLRRMTTEGARLPLLLLSVPVEFRKRLAEAFTALSEGLVERDTRLRLLLLAALAGEHLLSPGSPGTAKSELAGGRLSGSGLFREGPDALLCPQELFRPLSMRALEDDCHVRQTEGYLPTAELALKTSSTKATAAVGRYPSVCRT